ncbi:uncharacterized protein LOC141649363 [Silene latifolia]|uniref:uncharacterized protein LOC141649363 n=1 Tax=Silene latifolia TaxID=37657 RepID=UPI003D78898B
MEQCKKGEHKKTSQQTVKQVWRPVIKKVVTVTEPVPVRPVTQNQTKPTQVDGRSSVGFHTPIKRLVKMNTREVVKDGYSNEAFGANSYKEVAASPPKKSSGENGLFCLLETKIKNKAFNKAASSFSNWCITTNNGYHSGGRIWVLWKPNIFRVHVLEYNAQYVHMNVESLVDRSSFWLTMVYAFNGIHDRDSLWDNLRRVASLVSGPWAIAGDFNCVLSASKRVGGNTPSGEMEPFRSFIDLYAHFLPEGLFDHTPCILKSTNQGQGKRCFKYYNIWGGSKKFLPLVREHWDIGLTGTPMFRLAKNLKNLKPVLKSLNKDGYSDIENAANILQKQVISDEYEATLKLQELTKSKESFLSQKSKHQLIKDGDANSSYFHGMLKRRRNMNKVVMVKDMNGKMCDTQEQVQDTKKIHRRIIDQGPTCNVEYWTSLMKPVTGEEIKEALFSIPDIKSPGPDGYTMYKVISKFLCARLAEVLPHIVGQNQGAFTQQRSIQENILICQDLIRLYERPHASPRCMFKIDLQKAYDTVEWSFVGHLLDELNFPPGFKTILMQCITTTTFSLSVNGEMFGKGDATSMMLLLQSFATFSKATGLKVSASKSNAYFRNVPEQVKIEILQVSGFTEGSIPFKYLDYRRTPLVGWATIYRPKDEGGLGLKDQEAWNKAMVGRLVDWVAAKRD